jgi:hypothetical protein
MTVWILYNYDGIVEGVYTPEGKARREQQMLDEAILRRAHYNERLTNAILELKELRQPYIVEAELLLEEERVAKEANHTGRLKAARKQRKVLLKQAEHLTWDIKCKEEEILASQRLTKEDILYKYHDNYDWEEHYVME